MDDAVDRGVVRFVLVIEHRAHREQLGVEGIQRSSTRVKTSALVSHVTRAYVKIARKLVLDRQIPLLAVRQAIGIKRAIGRPALTVQETRIDEGWALEVLWKTLAEDKRSLQA